MVRDDIRPEYLWRYREGFSDGKDMDMLMLMEPSEGFAEGEPGELTIITW